jgi:uncharacterized membrane protein
MGYIDDAVSLARQLLTFQEPWHIALYSDLLLASRKVINPDFDITMMPMLEIENNEIYLSNLLEGSEVDIRIRMTNSGQETLVIHDIDVGCSCLELQSEVRREIKAGDKKYLHLLFIAEQRGQIRRNVRITNNSLEPVQTIAIRANVW